MPRYAVVLFNMGGPDSLESVETFLFNIFSDPDIFKLPFGQRSFARLLSWLRATKVKNRYMRIGGKSPINDWTELQRSRLQERLRITIPQIEVYTAMRYWKPFISEVSEKVKTENFDKVVLLPLYPHYSITTTGTSFNEWKRSYKGDHSRLIYVSDYFDNRKYISALNHRIDAAALRFPEHDRAEIQMVFSAHGTPEKLVKQGDPYSGQILATVGSVMEARHFSNEHHLCFQSRVGPLKWLGPPVDAVIKDLAGRGKRHLLLIPISFVSDNIETLFELNIEYRKTAERSGIENYIVMEGLNDSGLFIDALEEIAVKALQIDRQASQQN